MSMTAKYQSLTAGLARRVLHEPSLVEPIVLHTVATAADVSAQLAQFRGALPDAALDMLANDPAQQAKILELFADVTELAGDAAEKLRAANVSPSDIGKPLDIQKAWHGTHFLLAGTAWEPTEPPGNAVLGGVPVGNDLGFGPARLMTPEDVGRTSAALHALSVERFRGRYDAAALNQAKIYGGNWNDPSELDWLCEAFAAVRAYFAAAAQRGEAILLSLV